MKHRLLPCLGLFGGLLVSACAPEHPRLESTTFTLSPDPQQIVLRLPCTGMGRQTAGWTPRTMKCGVYFRPGMRLRTVPMAASGWMRAMAIPSYFR